MGYTVRSDKHCGLYIKDTDTDIEYSMDCDVVPYTNLKRVIAKTDTHYLVCAYNYQNDKAIDAIKRFGVLKIPHDEKFIIKEIEVPYINAESQLNPLIIISKDDKYFIVENFGDKEMHPLKSHWIGNHKYIHYFTTCSDDGSRWIVWFIDPSKTIPYEKMEDYTFSIANIVDGVDDLLKDLKISIV